MRRLVLLVLLLGGVNLASTASAQTLPVIEVTTNTPLVSEPNGFAEFVILKTPGPDITVRFEMQGSAVLGTDYMVIGDATSVTVPGSAEAALVRIQVIDDFLIEPDKTITLHLLPDLTYAIGAADSATVILHSDDPLNTPVPAVPILYINLNPSPSQAFDPVIVAPNSQVSARVSLSGSAAISVSLFVDAVKVATGKPYYGESAAFTTAFTAPSAGLHSLTAVATTAAGLSGVASAEFRVADALLPPASVGYITNANSVTTGSVMTFFDHGAETAAAFIEAPVPTAATNWNAQLFITPTGGNALNQLFAYLADGTVTTNDFTAPAEFIGLLDPAASNLKFQVDVTKWTQAAAGGYVGFKVRVDPKYAANSPLDGVASVFDNIRLAFFSPTNDVPLQFDWLNFSASHGYASDRPLDVNLRLYDPDSSVKNIQISDYTLVGRFYTNPIVADVAVDLPPGTNFYALAVTNLPVGTHYFSIRVTTDRGSVTHSYAAITVFQHDANTPAHRWLGTDGNAIAFYVVDAAGRGWVWGNNLYGQLGLGFKGGVLTRPAMLPAPAGKKWRQFTSNSYCAVGVTDEGELYGMGQNATTLTSVFTTTDPTVPSPLSLGGNLYARRAALTQSSLWIVNEWFTMVALLGPEVNNALSIVEMESGGDRLVARDDAGKLYYAPIGGRSSLLFDNPALGATLPWKTVSACVSHCLALDSGGQLFGWGSNLRGQLPFPSSDFVPNPQNATPPAGVSAWTMIAAGRDVSLAVDTNGRL
jgi:hypothetical protein